MRFWDSSAIVALCAAEDRTPALRSIARDGRGLVVWWGTRVECTSALARRERERSVAARILAAAWRRLDDLADAWIEIGPGGAVRDAALRLVRVHPLTAADALQLGAATVWAGGHSPSGEVVTLDRRLADAARREGFVVLE